MTSRAFRGVSRKERRRATTWVVVVLMAAALGAGCDPDVTRSAADGGKRKLPVGPEVVEPQERPASPPVLRMDNQARPPARRRVVTAIADLRALGVWRRLTRHLAVVQIQTRTGRSRIPGDGHLADAYWTALLERDRPGGLCSIVFYTSAMRADRARARSYFARGLTGPPPSPHAFWASVLAHELAHCLPGRPGERVARSWEYRVLDPLEDMSQ